MSIATAITRSVDSCAIGVKPKTDTDAMARTKTRTSFSGPTTTSPTVDGQSVRTKPTSLVNGSEVSRDLELTSTANDTCPLPSTRTTTTTLPIPSSPGDYAIEEGFVDNYGTYEPKLVTFPRIKPPRARGISLIGELIGKNTPHNTGSGEPLPPNEVLDYIKTEMTEDVLVDIEHYKSLAQLSEKIYCPDQGHEEFGRGMIDAIVMTAPLDDGTSVFVYHRTMTGFHHDEYGNDKDAGLI